ncbi:unnamed protein product [Rangifer tarandus platyrhynchus]|uniref:Uncharacterized protein n=2 Tax=Rangifer tarandus platyrhynchus TaxID=3082113 RepID=A0ABN8ZS92_RANTA|nr:unnamed protein product [Rangifer tarandus platyrhynchus]CAI9709587.1 unnamed protein product [Rangifer tarandus platyrhynchus]
MDVVDTGKKLSGRQRQDPAGEDMVNHFTSSSLAVKLVGCAIRALSRLSTAVDKPPRTLVASKDRFQRCGLTGLSAAGLAHAHSWVPLSRGISQGLGSAGTPMTLARLST